MSRSWRGARVSERGAAAVEFALLVPFLCLLVFGIISYGVMLSFRQSISQAASEGARAAAVSIDATAKTSNARAAVNEALQTQGVTCSGSDLFREGIDVGTCGVTGPGACTPVAVGVQCVTVTLTYEYRLHPLVPSLPGVGPVLPRDLTYSAQARVS